jgi:hypothetical protein
VEALDRRLEAEGHINPREARGAKRGPKPKAAKRRRRK